MTFPDLSANQFTPRSCSQPQLWFLRCLSTWFGRQSSRMTHTQNNILDPDLLRPIAGSTCLLATTSKLPRLRARLFSFSLSTPVLRPGLAGHERDAKDRANALWAISGLASCGRHPTGPRRAGQGDQDRQGDGWLGTRQTGTGRSRSHRPVWLGRRPAKPAEARTRCPPSGGQTPLC